MPRLADGEAMGGPGGGWGGAPLAPAPDVMSMAGERHRVQCYDGLNNEKVYIVLALSRR